MSDWEFKEEIMDCEFPGDSYIIEYNRDLGQYRISIFRDYHYKDEFTFDEVKK